MNPSTIQGTIFYGILAGVLTSALLFCVSQAFTAIILPWYQNVVYRGVRVDGEWEVTADDFAQIIRLKIKQSAYALHGDAAFMARDPELANSHEKLRLFIFKGKISDRFVDVSLRHTDSSRLGASVLLLEVVADGRIMEGILTFYSIGEKTVSSVKVVARRPDVTLPKPIQPELPLTTSIKGGKGAKEKTPNKAPQ